MYGGSFLGRKKLGRFLAPFDTKKGAFQIKPITNTETWKQKQTERQKFWKFQIEIMSSDEELEIPDFDHDLSDSEGESK